MMKASASAMLAVSVLAAALAGCGGAASSTAASPSTASQPPSAASVAQRLGCTDVQPVTPPTLYAYDEAGATCGGHSADIATFRTDQLRDKWVQIASQFGGIQQTGELYAVADG